MYVYNDVAIVQTRQVQGGEPYPNLTHPLDGITTLHWHNAECWRDTRVYPKVSGLAAWSENSKW
jgi:hypothetical protein